MGSFRYLPNPNSVEISMTAEAALSSEPKPTLDDAITELKRELNSRGECYPKWIESGKIKREIARQQYARMQCALKYLLRLQEQATL